MGSGEERRAQYTVVRVKPKGLHNSNWDLHPLPGPVTTPVPET